MRYLLCLLMAAGAAALVNAKPACSAGTSVLEEGFVPIGEIDQWISIRGANRANPVIVVIHGGPAVANSALQSTYSAWEKCFTVVQWDQRGSGKTFGRSGGKSTNDMTVDRMVQDGLEVAENVRKRLDKKKVILLGHSWGSFLGITIMKKRPDLFSAYVGTGQVVSSAETMKAQYAFIVKRAEAEGNHDALKELRDVGPPPYEMGPTFSTLQKLGDRYIPDVDKQFLQKLMDTVKSAPNFSPQDVQDWMGGRQFSMRVLGPVMAAMDLIAKQGYDMPVPFYIIQGEDDHITPTTAVEDYFKKIHAPRKQIRLVKGAGHFAYATSPDEFLADLEKFVGAPAGKL